MFVLWLYRLFSGYVKVIAVKGFPERIINICYKNSITVWGIKKENEKLIFNIGAKDFKKLKKLRAKSEIRLHIVSKIGLPFLINKNKKRSGLIVGFVLFFAILHFLSGFIWNINVVGNKSINSKEILEQVKEIGIKEGMSSKKIKSAEMRNTLLYKYDKLSWISFNVEGSKLTINVSEANTPTPNIKNPSNLIADFDGVIKKIELKSGYAAVKIDDAVKKGDLLASGVKEYEDGVSSFTHSEGKIIAQTVRNIKITIPYKSTVNKRTGKVYDRKVFYFFGLEIPLFLGSVKGQYDISVTENFYKTSENYLPIKIIHAKLYEIKTTQEVITKEQAKALAIKKSEEKLKEYSPIKNISLKDSFTEENGALILNREATIYEDISKQENIKFEIK